MSILSTTPVVVGKFFYEINTSSNAPRSAQNTPSFQRGNVQSLKNYVYGFLNFIPVRTAKKAAHQINLLQKNLVMADTFILTHAQVHTESKVLKSGYVYVSQGKIKDVGEYTKELDQKLLQHQIHKIKLPSKFKVIPGMIDIHTHGVGLKDTMDASVESLNYMAKEFPREGITSFLPTTITAPVEQVDKALINAVNYIEKYNTPGKAEVLGVHVEGPMISSKKLGSHNKKFVIPPQVALFKKWQKLAKGWIKILTYAPELDPDYALTKYLKKSNVIASLGHSNATIEDTEEAFKHGVKHLTHVFNAMQPIHHRNPGAIPSALLNKDIKLELINDGIHVHPKIVELLYKMVGKDRIMVITDASSIKGLSDGKHIFGHQETIVKNGKATLAIDSNVLAGSIARMMDVALNMIKFTKASLHDVTRMTAYNQAKALNILDRKGSIAPRKDADLLILDEKNNLFTTICRGIPAYQVETQSTALKGK